MITTLKPRIWTIDTKRGVGAAIERITGWKLQKIRQRILLRDEYTCQMCGRVGADLLIDHIVPLHLGGQESDENRQSICDACHMAKNEREAQDRG